MHVAASVSMTASTSSVLDSACFCSFNKSTARSPQGPDETWPRGTTGESFERHTKYIGMDGWPWPGVLRVPVVSLLHSTSLPVYLPKQVGMTHGGPVG